MPVPTGWATWWGDVDEEAPARRHHHVPVDVATGHGTGGGWVSDRTYPVERLGKIAVDSVFHVTRRGVDRTYCGRMVRFPLGNATKHGQKVSELVEADIRDGLCKSCKQGFASDQPINGWIVAVVAVIVLGLIVWNALT